MSNIIMARHRTWQFDLLIRTTGIVLLGLAMLSMLALVRAVEQRPAHPGVAAFLLAAGGFVGASAGMMALTAGRALFDPLPLPPRSLLRAAAAQPISAHRPAITRGVQKTRGPLHGVDRSADDFGDTGQSSAMSALGAAEPASGTSRPASIA
jgi:hypothetical protein